MFEFKKEWMVKRDQDYNGLKPYYERKYHTLSQLDGINRIAEIGVRAGYSARCFMEAKPMAKYYGFDNYQSECTYGSTNIELYKNALMLVEDYNSHIAIKNTQQMKNLDIYNIDFFHVDGDHSYNGAWNDLKLALDALSRRGYILIDDVGSGISSTMIQMQKNVRAAADEFVKINNLNYKFINSGTGEYLIWRK